MASPARVQVWPVPAGAWQAQLRNLVFGQNTPYSFEAVEGLDLPAISDGDIERAGVDGMIGGLETTAARDLIFDMLVHPDLLTGSSKAIMMQALKAAFAESSDDIGLTLQHPDLGPLLFIGRPRRASFKVDRQHPWLSQEGVITLFKALDPLIYSGNLQDITIPYGTAGLNAGLPFRNASFIGMTFAPQRIIPNGSFEDTGLTPWTSYHDTLATDATAPPFGAANLKCTNNDTAGAFGAYVTGPNMREPGANWIPGLAASGGYVTSSAYFRVSNTSIRARLYHSYSGSTDIAQAWQTLPANTWTRLTFTTQVPAGSTDFTAYFMFENYDLVNNGKIGLLDAALVEKGQVASTYTLPLMGATFGAVGGGGGAAGFSQLVNNGTANTDPVSRIKAVGGPVTGPLYLDRVESNESIVLNYNMANGDVLELDHDLHSVLLNGVTNRADILDASTSWWSLAPGTNTIHYRTGGPGAGSQAEVLYRDAYW